MKLIKHNFENFQYNYMVKFYESEGMSVTVDEAANWAESVGIDCVVCAGESYFLTEQDAMTFMLKYSGS